MNKGLDALHRLYLTSNVELPYCKDGECLKDFELVEKELKTFEIIKKKKVNVSSLLELDNLQQYNAYCNFAGSCKKLTQEEYDLLKEVGL